MGSKREKNVQTWGALGPPHRLTAMRLVLLKFVQCSAAQPHTAALGHVLRKGFSIFTSLDIWETFAKEAFAKYE